MKKTVTFLLLCIPILSLCSCWDYTEVNMQDYVFGMAVDKTDNTYNVSIETLQVKGSAEQSSSKGTVIKTQGENLFDAIRSAITHAGKKLYWGHFQLAVIGESVAKENFEEILDTLSRAQDVYLNIALVIARNTPAEEILSAKLPKETMVTDHIMDIFDNEKPSRHFHLYEAWEVYRDMSISNTYALPAISLNKDKIPEINGSAIFKDGKLAGFLSGDETVMLSLLTENASGGYLPYVKVSDNLNVSLEISQNRVTPKATVKDGKPAINIKSEILVSLSRASGECNIMDEVTQTQIGQAAQREIHTRMQRLCDRIKSDNLGDPLHFAHMIEVCDSNWWKNNKNSWQETLNTLPISLDVAVSLNSAGMTKHSLTFN